MLLYSQMNLLVTELEKEGYENIRAIRIDVTKPETIQSARDIIQKDQGKLDILINNAGISGEWPQTASSVSIENLSQNFEINFYGPIRVSQMFIELLKKSDSPRITNITSGLASLTLQSDPDWTFYNFKAAAYFPSKAALNAYTICLAHELKDLGFKVNAIDPGYTKTDFTQHKGTGTVESAASFIIKHTLTDSNGPTGKYFSNEIHNQTEESPW